MALKRGKALTALGGKGGSQTIVVPAPAMDAFVEAFRMLRGRG